MSLAESGEMYLETIYVLSQKSAAVHSGFYETKASLQKILIIILN